MKKLYITIAIFSCPLIQCMNINNAAIFQTFKHVFLAQNANKELSKAQWLVKELEKHQSDISPELLFTIPLAFHKANTPVIYQGLYGTPQKTSGIYDRNDEILGKTYEQFIMSFPEEVRPAARRCLPSAYQQ